MAVLSYYIDKKQNNKRTTDTCYIYKQDKKDFN